MTPYRVPVSTVPLLQDPPFVLGLVLLATALGYRLLRLLRAPLGEVTALERGVLAAALGLGLLQYLPFGLGMARVLKPAAVWIGLAVLAVLLAPDMARVARGAGRAVGSLRAAPPPRWVVAGTLILAVPLTAALLAALCPPTDIDGIYYHLTAPKRWLQAGALSYLPTLSHTNSPMGVNMLYTVAMAVWSDTAAKLIHYALGLLSLLAIFALGRRLRSVEVGFAAAALWMIGLARVDTLDASRLFSWAYVDLGITLQVVCAALAWTIACRVSGVGHLSTRAPEQLNAGQSWLICAALCAGFAASFKLTGAFTGAALALLLLAARRREGMPMGRAALHGAGFLALSLLPVAPWLLRSWVQTGSPVYLVLPRLFPTRDWSPEAAAAFDSYFKHYVWGTGSGGMKWSLATRKMLRIGAMLAVGGVGALAIWRWREWEARALIFLAAALFLTSFWSTGLYLRYLVPALPLVYVLALSRLERPLKSSRWAQGAVLLLLAVNTVLYLRSTTPPVRLAARVAAGRMSREAYLERRIPVMPLWNHVNQTLPPDARILLAAGRPSYYMEPYCFITEAYYQARIRMDTWENFLSDLRRDGIGYAIVPEKMARSAPIGPDYAPARNEAPFARRLVEEHGRRLYSTGRDSLYRLENL